MKLSKLSLWNGGVSPAKMLILAFCLHLCLSAGPLSACAMSAMIASQGHRISDFRQQGDPNDYWDFNDPYDYFGFVMSTSTPYLNSDGYGVVVYSDSDPTLDNRRAWYKRVLTDMDFGSVYYTGQYLRSNFQNVHHYNDVLDNALYSIMSGADDPVIVMCHARNATGSTFGNHPFRFDYQGRSYSFMHNGFVNSARSYMIARIHDLYPESNWFVEHPSNYFEETDPQGWVDTEVLFHYIMSHVASSGSPDPLYGIINALRDLSDYLTSPRTGVFNFVMSDGSKLYAFRNTPLTGANSGYKLSYRNFNNEFYAIRTQTPTAQDIQLMPLELVVFSRNTKPVHYSVLDPAIFANNLDFPPQILTRSSINPDKVSIRIAPNPLINPDGHIVLRITAPASSNRFEGSLDLYNIRGQLVLRRDLGLLGWDSVNDLDLANIPNGTYLCRVMIGSFTAHSKITIAR